MSDVSIHSYEKNGDMARNANTFTCAAALVNTLLGVSTVGSAHGFAEAGFALGTIFLVAFGSLSGLGLYLLACSARTVGVYPTSYFAVAKAATPRFTLAIDVAVAVKCFGVATSFLIVIGDLMPSAMEGILREQAPNILFSRYFWITTAMCWVSPLAALKSLGALRYTATLSVGFALFLVSIVLSYAVTPSLQPSRNNHYVIVENAFGEPKRVLRVLSIFIFAFTCHQNIFSVCNEIRKPTPQRIRFVIILAIVTAATVHLTISWSAFITFGKNISDNLLNDYPHGVPLTMARICVALLVSTGYPLQIHPCRNSIMNVMQAVNRSFYKSKRDRVCSECTSDSQKFIDHVHNDTIGVSPMQLTDSSLEFSNGTLVKTENFTPEFGMDYVSMQSPTSRSSIYSQKMNSNLLFKAVTVVLLMFSYVIAMSISDLGVVLEVIGATGSTTISYILPGSIYLALHTKRDVLWFAACIQLGLGCVIMPMCLFFIAQGCFDH